ncbi:MAG: sulfite exporter TauE/SafE family protein [Sandaracinaceae bacterium]|nr:sulfite exporter TauE/SafE family protein [Sandaracinaceae bacterium]
MDASIAVFALIVFGSYALQTITGFGSTLLLLTFGAHLLPIPEIVALAVPISVMQSSYIGVRHRSGIDWKLLGARILPLMGGGLAVGFFAFRGVGAGWMQTAFAVLVLALSAREIVAMVRAARAEPVAVPVPERGEAPPPSPAGPAALPKPIAALFVLAAGVIHGVYATGGPLLVYALGRSGLSKHAFRSTLAIVWLVLDLVLTVSFTIDGRYDRQSLIRLAIIVPAMPLGVLVGEALHHRVDERRFRYLVFALLVAGALSLLAR